MMDSKNSVCFTCSQNIVNDSLKQSFCLKQLCKILKLPVSLLSDLEFLSQEIETSDLTKLQTTLCFSCFELINNAEMIRTEIENLENELVPFTDKIKSVMTSNFVGTNSTQSVADPTYSIRKSFVQCWEGCSVPVVKLEDDDSSPQKVYFAYLNPDEIEEDNSINPNSVIISPDEENHSVMKNIYLDFFTDPLSIKNENVRVERKSGRVIKKRRFGSEWDETSSYLVESDHQDSNNGRPVVDKNSSTACQERSKRLQNIKSPHFSKDENPNCDVTTSSRPKCTKCNRNFKDVLSRDIHIKRIHEGDQKPYTCNVCQWKFVSPSKLMAHAKARGHPQELESMILKDTTLQDSQIEIVNNLVYSGSSKDSLASSSSSSLSYSSTSNLEKCLKCTDCKLSFRDESSLDAHYKGKHEGIERPFQCSILNCSKSYEKRSHLEEHQKVHGGGKDRPFICVWCDNTSAEPNNQESTLDNPEMSPPISFSTEKKLRLHILTKHQNNKCEQCDRNFKSPYILERHLSSHSSSQTTSKTNFICEVCGKKYSALKRLKVHQMRHNANSTEPYACHCGKVFSEPRTLQCHRASVHEQVFKYYCKICGQGCQQIYMLNRHMLCHSAEKNYECPTCHLKFKRKPQLIIHERKHTGEKPFSCKLCNKAFTEKKKLKNHEILHSGKKPFECNYDGCNKAFALRHYLTHHINTSHKNKQVVVIQQQEQVSQGHEESEIQVAQDEQPEEHSIIAEHEIVLDFIPNESEVVPETIVYATDNGGEWIQFGFVHGS